ncbi:MAG: multicomponent Na+:H+ antiporter subunit [Candidatus Petromonas sp.]|nr:multicomponent Na+:H+ antiporter subunit [Candidatus Petromonas sp.]
MKQKLKYNITAILIYLLFWFILAERINFQAFTVGLMICLVVYNFNRDNIEEFFGKNFTASQKISCIIKYVLLLVKEIIIANFQVAKIVLSRDMKISPNVVKFKTNLKKDLSKTILANSITLTPGTITIEVKGDEFTVHCLSEKNIEGIINSKFEKILLKIEE